VRVDQSKERITTSVGFAAQLTIVPALCNVLFYDDFHSPVTWEYP
jgi:hypothetical protein